MSFKVRRTGFLKFEGEATGWPAIFAGVIAISFFYGIPIGLAIYWLSAWLS